MKEATEYYEIVHSRLEQAISFLIAICEEKHIAANSDKQVASCANAAQSLVYDAGEELTQLWKCVQPAGAEIKSETSKPITMDQLDELTLPLGKAHSILELFIDDLPADQANGGYVAKTLIKEAIQIGHDWAGLEYSTPPGGAA